MIFVDASALVAILTREPDWQSLEDVLILNRGRLSVSPLVIWETVRAVMRKREFGAEEARGVLRRYLDRLDVKLVPIGAPEGEAALEAMARYGKGLGHPADLNLGDCFAYACAKTHGAALLFKGDDFSETDVERV